MQDGSEFCSNCGMQQTRQPPAENAALIPEAQQPLQQEQPPAPEPPQQPWQPPAEQTGQQPPWQQPQTQAGQIPPQQPWQPTEEQPWQPPAAQPPAPGNKSKTALIAVCVAAVVVIALAVVLIATNVFGLFGKGSDDDPPEDENVVSTGTGDPSGNDTNPATPTPGDATPGSALAGTWHGITQSYHGNGVYIWSFGEDGRFAFLYSAVEPPSGGIDLFSVREVYMQGRYRENGDAIECYDIRADDFYRSGSEYEWKYFPDRDPARLAGVLLDTPLMDSESVSDFSIAYRFEGGVTLRLEVDCGVFPYQYDMDFEYVAGGGGMAEPPEAPGVDPTEPPEPPEPPEDDPGPTGETEFPPRSECVELWFSAAFIEAIEDTLITGYFYENLNVLYESERASENIIIYWMPWEDYYSELAEIEELLLTTIGELKNDNELYPEVTDVICAPDYSEIRFLCTSDIFSILYGDSSSAFAIGAVSIVAPLYRAYVSLGIYDNAAIIVEDATTGEVYLEFDSPYGLPDIRYPQ